MHYKANDLQQILATTTRKLQPSRNSQYCWSHHYQFEIATNSSTSMSLPYVVVSLKDTIKVRNGYQQLKRR